MEILELKNATLEIISLKKKEEEERTSVNRHKTWKLIILMKILEKLNVP